MAPSTGATGKEYIVSPTGNDANPGSITRPLRTIVQGVNVVQAGDVLSLREGVYVESVVVANKHGTVSQPVPGELQNS